MKTTQHNLTKFIMTGPFINPDADLMARKAVQVALLDRATPAFWKLRFYDAFQVLFAASATQEIRAAFSCDTVSQIAECFE